MSAQDDTSGYAPRSPDLSSFYSPQPPPAESALQPSAHPRHLQTQIQHNYQQYSPPTTSHPSLPTSVQAPEASLGQYPLSGQYLSSTGQANSRHHHNLHHQQQQQHHLITSVPPSQPSTSSTIASTFPSTYPPTAATHQAFYPIAAQNSQQQQPQQPPLADQSFATTIPGYLNALSSDPTDPSSPPGGNYPLGFYQQQYDPLYTQPTQFHAQYPVGQQAPQLGSPQSEHPILPNQGQQLSFAGPSSGTTYQFVNQLAPEQQSPPQQRRQPKDPNKMAPRRSAQPPPPPPPIRESPVRTKFPTARIKRIMQADEEVGKVAQQTPIAVGKALELFMVDLVSGSAEVAKEKGQRRITAAMLKQVIETDDQWDFLREIVSKVDTEEKKPGRTKAESESEEEVVEPKKRGRASGRKKKA